MLQDLTSICEDLGSTTSTPKQRVQAVHFVPVRSAQQVKEAATKSEDLNLLPKPHTGEGEKRLSEGVFSDLHG